MTTRRKFLQTAATVPAVVAAPIFGQVAAMPSTIPPDPHPFGWYFSYNGEIYDEEFSSKDDALKFLKAAGEGMISECQRQNYSLDVDGNDILEMLYGQNDDLIGEGEFIDCTTEQLHELGDVVTAAIDQWAAKHKIDITAWSFGHIRNTIHAKEVCDPKVTCERP
jgi:hypothetical protein